MELRNVEICKLIDYSELTDLEVKDFDWCSGDEWFFRYRGTVYCVSEFMASAAFPLWDGVSHDTWFSGVLIKLNPDDDDSVIRVATYLG